jgi:cytochrome c oxidase subunit IV
MNEATAPNLGLYWRTWGVLLVLTAVMFFLDSMDMPRGIFVAIMLTAMLAKAALIGGIFMHLAQESRDLMVTVVVCCLGLGALLYALSAVDAWRISQMLQGIFVR